jgi:GNAT superfamily N-acetyltransferase
VSSSITIRRLTADDVLFMRDMILEAAFVPQEIRDGWRDGSETPEPLRKYVDGWGRKGDDGVLATDGGGSPLGAAWYRLYSRGERGDGVLAHDNVPEIAIALRPEHRGQGIGGKLLDALANLARDSGYDRLMLSVDPANPARRLYTRHGYIELDTDDAAAGTSIMMVANL